MASSPLDQCPKLEMIYVCLLSGSYDYINIGYYAVTFFLRHLDSAYTVSEAVAGRDLGFCLC